MSSSSSHRLPRVADYDLAPPSDGDARAMLERIFGAEHAAALWTTACGDARLDPAQIDSLPKLERVAASLASAGGAAMTVARSLEIRIRTYTRLAARDDSARGAGA